MWLWDAARTQRLLGPCLVGVYAAQQGVHDVRDQADERAGGAAQRPPRQLAVVGVHDAHLQKSMFSGVHEATAFNDAQKRLLHTFAAANCSFERIPAANRPQPSGTSLVVPQEAHHVRELVGPSDAVVIPCQVLWLLQHRHVSLSHRAHVRIRSRIISKSTSATNRPELLFEDGHVSPQAQRGIER